jgi:hypothetical protein
LEVSESELETGELPRLRKGHRFGKPPPKRIWVIGVVGQYYFATKFEYDPDDFDSLYDPDNVSAMRSYIRRERFTKEEAIRLVDRMKTKVPLTNIGNVEGHPSWGKEKTS